MRAGTQKVTANRHLKKGSKQDGSSTSESMNSSVAGGMDEFQHSSTRQATCVQGPTSPMAFIVLADSPKVNESREARLEAVC